MTLLKKLLAKKLTKKELLLLRGSFDIIGTIAIIEIPHTLEKKEKLIATTIQSLNPHIKTVAKKIGSHTGKYRRQKLKILSGIKTKVTEHKESGIRLRLNIESCYFSPRLGTERLRIASLIKKPEHVLVLFSGIAPYPLVLAKYSPAKKIACIEMNPAAHTYAQENVLLNKYADKITLYHGDVRKIVPTIKETFDRIIMPLPKTGEEFLPLVLNTIKKKGMIHLYQFAHENTFHQYEQKILDICNQHKKKCTIINTIKAGQHAPRVYRICIDIQVERKV